MRRLRSTLRWWGWRRVVSVVVGIPLFAFSAFVLLRSPSAPVEAGLARASTTTSAPDAQSPSDAPGTSVATITVHVAGRVSRADVYGLPGGARVVDAVAAAGGAAPFADLDAVNLAAPLVDGQQVYIPAIGEAPRASVIGGASVGPGSTTVFEPVDINTADETALDGLPGVGPATARAIVAFRDEHGPFATVQSLDQVPGIGPGKVASLEGLVTTG